MGSSKSKCNCDCKCNCWKTFVRDRLNPSSFSSRIEGALRQSFAFFIAGIIMIFYGNQYFSMGIITMMLTQAVFGATILGARMGWRGTIVIPILSTVMFYVPVISTKYWYCVLIYVFIASLFINITMFVNAMERKLSLLMLTSTTIQLCYGSTGVESVWLGWLIIPFSIIICIFCDLFPYPVFAYQKLLHIEKLGLHLLGRWVKDILPFFECKTKTQARICGLKTQKYQKQSTAIYNGIQKLLFLSQHFEALSPKNEIINQKRINTFCTLHYIVYAMNQSISDVIELCQSISEIKESFETLIARLEYCLLSMDTMQLNDLQDIKQELIELNNTLLTEYENSKILQQLQTASQSNDAFNSFLYFLGLFVKVVGEYIDLYSKYKQQIQNAKLGCWNNFVLFFSISIYEVLYPFPYVSWTDFLTRLSPSIHWKSSIFRQSLAISVALTAASVFWIAPTFQSNHQVGYWTAVTVAFTGELQQALGSTVNISRLRLEGTFYGVVYGYIILLIQYSANLTELFGIVMLSLWVLICMYMSNHPTRGYAYGVASFTALIIVEGYNEQASTPQAWALDRIVATGIGIALTGISLQIFSPNKAPFLLRNQIEKTMVVLRQMFDATFKTYNAMVYGTIVSEEHNKEQMEDDSWGNYEQKLDVIVSDKDELIEKEHDEWELKLDIKKESRTELMQKFRSDRLSVVGILTKEKVFIQTSSFEPNVITCKEFDDEFYYKLYDIQCDILWRIEQIQCCLQSILVYIEENDVRKWQINMQMVGNVSVFKSYLELFEKFHGFVINSMETFTTQETESNDESIAFECENIQNKQWLRYKQIISKYVNISEINQNANGTKALTTKGILVISTLNYALRKLLVTIAKYGECRILFDHQKKQTKTD